MPSVYLGCEAVRASIDAHTTGEARSGSASWASIFLPSWLLMENMLFRSQ